MSSNFIITHCAYIRPQAIIPGRAISAQYITGDFQFLFAPYQVFTEQIKSTLVKLMPEEQFLVAFTDRPAVPQGADEIAYFEHVVSAFIAQQEIEHAEKEAGFEPTPEGIEKKLQQARDIIQPVIFGNYDQERIFNVVDTLLQRQFRGVLKPNSIGTDVYLLIDRNLSMNTGNRLNAAKMAAGIFYRHLERWYRRDSIRVYAFSGITSRIDPRKVSGIGLAPATLLGKALRVVCDSIVPSSLLPKHIYIFTDGLPQDYDAVLHYCERLRGMRVDIDVILFLATERELLSSVNEYPQLIKFPTPYVMEKYRMQFEEFVNTAGGNLLIVNQNALLPQVQTILYDHYKFTMCELANKVLQEMINWN